MLLSLTKLNLFYPSFSCRRKQSTGWSTLLLRLDGVLLPHSMGVAEAFEVCVVGQYVRAVPFFSGWDLTAYVWVAGVAAPLGFKCV